MKNDYDVVIIGGGPAGSTAAKEAAEQGVSVLVLEKDRDIGYPVRCGEAVNAEGLTDFIEPNPQWIASTINSFRLISPDNTEVKLNFEKTGYILNRKIFDYALAEEASKKGAQFLTRAYAYGLVDNGNNFSGVNYEHNGEKKIVNAKIIIGADGVESRVGRFAGLNTYTDFRDMESCVQITASNLPDLDTSSCYFYFGNNLAPGGYLWVFPKGKNTANIGLGIGGDKAKKKAPVRYLNDFMNKRFPDHSQLTFISGGVPCAVTHKKIVNKNVLLAGDSAQQVNPLSGGGIISGMIAGRLAGKYAAKAVKSGNLNELLGYPKEWHERVGKKHESYYRLKNGIYRFTDEKLNNIAHSAIKIDEKDRSLGALFRIALFDNPGLLIDILKLWF